ncbi:MAG: aldehyde dehydrogenase family protein [Verrucomicrobia bacterium]|nr:aldehyde dehydrogenase family protein [Verrucomicrobiota bacterium]
MTVRPLPTPASVHSWLAQPRRMLIGGAWVSAVSGETFETLNPATGQPITAVPSADAADVDAAVRAARAAFDSGPWRQMSPSERGKRLWALADLVERHAGELAALERLDSGKPQLMAQAVDLPATVDILRYMAGWATKLEGRTVPLSVPYAPGAQFHAYTVREPVGVVGQIIPWNFPAMMAAMKLGPALAAGCTVVLKPAEETPLSALRLGELVCEAGFPDGVVNVVTGFGERAGAALAAHPGVDKVAFTGSTEVGRLIVRAASHDLKRVSLELGGKSPNILLEDADLEAAMPAAAAAIFFNQGECCTAGSLLYVHRRHFDRVLEGVAAAARAIPVGPGDSPSSQMGPLVSEAHRTRVLGYLESGRTEGAVTVAGGSGLPGPGFFLQPTVLAQTRPGMRVMDEEIFGPVVCAVPFDDPGEVVAAANRSRFGLAAAVWTRDVSRAHRLAAALRAGTVWVNCYNILDAALPFGGARQSGWGREMGEEALALYTETKSVCVQI